MLPLSTSSMEAVLSFKFSRLERRMENLSLIHICHLEDIVQENHYVRRDGQQLRKMFEKECTHQSFEEWCEKFCRRKYNSDFSREMSRSVEARCV